jgi:hypothetical protein
MVNGEEHERRDEDGQQHEWGQQHEDRAYAAQHFGL